MSKQSITLVDNQYELRDVTRMAKMDFYDRGVKGALTDIDTVKSPRGQKLVTISKRMARFGAPHGNHDELIFRTVGANEAAAVFDMGVRGKIEDVVLPFKGDIRYYGPLTDVNAENMPFFITHDAADVLDNGGVDLELFGEELDEVRSIDVTEEQNDLAKTTYNHREDVSRIKRQMSICRAKIERCQPQLKDAGHDQFVQALMKGSFGEDGYEYLKLESRLIKNKNYIDTYSSGIMAITAPQVFVPSHISRDDLRLPCFDIVTERFVSEKLSMSDIVELANRSTVEIEEISLEEIPELAIDL